MIVLGLLGVLAVLVIIMMLIMAKGAGRNRTDSEGKLTPLNYFDTPIPTNRAARRHP